jgi:hypothetical protein
VLSGLLCLLVPVGIAFVVFRMVVRGRQASPPSLTPIRPARAAPTVRIVDDGFWIRSDWPPGSALSLKYLIGGMPMSQHITYQPGPEGHYVFTGQRPDSVTVTAETAEPAAETPPLPPVLPSDTWSDTPRATPVFHDPPRRPSAY